MKESLYLISICVYLLIVPPLPFEVFLWWHNCLYSWLMTKRVDLIAWVSPIHDKVLHIFCKSIVFNNMHSMGIITLLSSRESEMHPMIRSSREHVYLGGETSTRLSYALLPLFLLAHAAWWCVRTTVLSRKIIFIWRTSSTSRVRRILHQRPDSLHRLYRV